MKTSTWIPEQCTSEREGQYILVLKTVTGRIIRTKYTTGEEQSISMIVFRLNKTAMLDGARGVLCAGDDKILHRNTIAMPPVLNYTETTIALSIVSTTQKIIALPPGSTSQEHNFTAAR